MRAVLYSILAATVLLAAVLLLFAPSPRSPFAAELTAGQAAPEIHANRWLNIDGTPSLAVLRGKLVVVEFWATWCPPCVEAIPHLNEVHEKYGPRGVTLLALTSQPLGLIEDFVKEHGMKFPIGAGSQSLDAYGIVGIPQSFLIGPDGVVLWAGLPNKDLDAAIDAALAAPPGRTRE